MSKTLRTAALVVGAIALVATGVGAVGAIAAGTSISAGVAGASAFGLSVGTISAISSGFALAATVTAKKPKSSTGGDQTRFTANMAQGLPYVMGRTSVSGFIVHRQTGGADNLYQTFFAVLSAAGPIEAIETFNVDGAPVSFANGAAQGSDYAGWMWLRTQLGAQPEPAALTPFVPMAGWDSSSRLSGYAAYAWTLKYDTKGKKYPAGVPEPSAILKGVKAYDPRQDSTYPGGSGGQRAGDESTWGYTDNAYLHGLTWLIGRRQNGKRVMGVGAPLDGIDVAAYVEAANLAAANGWSMGGVVYSTDEKWAALKAMLQAGGGEPTRIGARISCTINAPRVSLDTIRSSDLVGDASVAATQSRRDRINAVVPRYRSEAHGWEMVAAKQVVVPAYVTEDGGQRTKEIEFPLVQDAKIAAQLAAYEVVNAREFGPITLPLKPRWIGYKPGDCLTIDIPELNMVGQTALIINRSLDPSTGVVTLTLKSETAAKHDFALGRTANPPPTPSLQVIDPSQLLIPGITAVWDDVRDPNGTKPVNNATNSADPDSPFGPDGKTVNQILADVAAALAGSGADTSEIAAMLARIQQAARQGLPNLALGGNLAEWPGRWQGALDRYTVLYDTDNGNVLHHIFQGAAPGDENVWLDVPVRPGMPTSFSYEGSAFGSGVDAEDCRIVGQWIDAGGNSLGFHSDLRPTVAAFTARNESAVVAAPANTALLRVIVVSPNSGAGFDLARIMVQAGPATAWRDDASQTENSRKVTQLEGDSAAYAEAINVLSAQVNGFTDSGLKRSIATISDQAIAAADAAAAVAQRVSKTEASLRQGSPNLFVPGDFKNGLVGWQGAVTRYDVLLATDKGNVLRHLPTGSTVVDESIWYDTPVTAGMAHSGGYEGLAFGPYAAGCRIVRLWLDANGAGLGFLPDILPTGGWEVGRHASAAVTAPPGAVAVRTIVVCPNSGSDFYLTRIMVQEGEATAWRDDAGSTAVQAQVKRAEVAIATVDQARAEFQTTATARLGNVEGAVNVQGGALVELDNRTQAYLRFETRAGSSGTDVVFMSVDGQPSLLYFRADQIVLDGDTLITGTVRWRAMDAQQFGKSGSGSWTGGPIQPAPGTSQTIPFALNIGTIKPSGKFTSVTGITVVTDVGTSTVTTLNGKPYRVYRTADGTGVGIRITDNEGNIYSFTAGTKVQPVRATSDFAGNVTAIISNGNYDSGLIDDGDSYRRYVSGTVSVTAISLELGWSWS